MQCIKFNISVFYIQRYQGSVQQLERETQESIKKLQVLQQQQQERHSKEETYKKENQHRVVNSLQTHISLLEKELDYTKERVQQAELDKHIFI